LALTTGTLGIARDLRRRILASPLTPARMVLVQGPAIVASTQEPELWIEMHGTAKLMERAGGDLTALAAASGAAFREVEPAQAELLWERVTNLHSWKLHEVTGAAVLKASLPDSAVEELVSRVEQESAAEKCDCSVIAQLGVGIAHFFLLSDQTVETQAGLIRRLRAAAESLGGVLVIERAPLALKQQFDVWGTSGSDSGLMKKMKEAWDPRNTLSPGRGLGRL
jgi:FAD/FMN-containing dehydrogenase